MHDRNLQLLKRHQGIARHCKGSSTKSAVMLMSMLRSASERAVSWRRKGGSYFYKRDRGFQQLERPFFLAVEDPQDVTNDLAKGSYAIQKVFSCPQLKSTPWHDH